MESKYQVRKYQVTDFYRMDMSYESQEIVDFWGVDTLSREYKDKAFGFTGLFDGEPVILAGVYLLWPGMGEAWALLSKDFRKHGIFIHRSVMKYLPLVAESQRLKRIQAVCDESHKEAVDWLKRLDFTFEGRMPMYWKKKSFFRFAKFFLLGGINEQVCRVFPNGDAVSGGNPTVPASNPGLHSGA